MKNVREGVQGFYRNRVNPHDPSTQAYREWQFGYDKAYFEQLERQKDYESKRQKAQIYA